MNERKKTRLNPFGQELSKEVLERQVDDLLAENDRLSQELEANKATCMAQGNMLMMQVKKIDEQWAVIQSLAGR